MPNTVYEGGIKSKLFQQVTDMFPDTAMVTVQRKYFNENKGLEYIRRLCVPEYSTIEMEINAKYYCLAAASAVIKYVEFIQNVIYAPHSVKVIFKGSANTTMIDSSTASHLELVTNVLDHRSEKTLFGVLQHTHTPGGSRMLRANILQPPSDLNTINTRQDCIAELIDNEEFFYSLKSVIVRFVDAEQLLSLCVQIPKEESVRGAEQKITNVIYLKHTLDLVAPLRVVLRPSKNLLFQTYFEPNINGLLDIARRTYTEIVDDIADLTKQIGEKYNLPLRIGYSTIRGFYLQMSIDRQSFDSPSALPPVFIKVVRSRNVVSFTTEDLIKLNDRIKESLNEIFVMTNIVLTQLLGDICENIGCLYKLTEAVSTIDFLLSLTYACTLSNHVRPSFGDIIAIKDGRHPILDEIGRETFVPNNTFLSDENCFIVITGPNMSGKSTYLKQVALLQIMAQIGAYVPAEIATFRISDQIFSRMGCSDSIENNCSTFMLEMKEANYILQNATRNSLIVIDELGQETRLEDGVGISFAISEEIIKIKAFALFATHYMHLTQLEDQYPEVTNYHFQVEHVVRGQEETCAINYTHKLTIGRSSENFYGIRLARTSSMPPSVVNHAEKLIGTWMRENQEKEAENPNFENIRKQRDTIRLIVHLKQVARNSGLDEENLRTHLHSLQQHYKGLKDTSLPQTAESGIINDCGRVTAEQDDKVHQVYEIPDDEVHDISKLQDRDEVHQVYEIPDDDEVREISRFHDDDEVQIIDD